MVGVGRHQLEGHSGVRSSDVKPEPSLSAAHWKCHSTATATAAAAAPAAAAATPFPLPLPPTPVEQRSVRTSDLSTVALMMSAILAPFSLPAVADISMAAMPATAGYSGTAEGKHDAISPQLLARRLLAQVPCAGCMH